MSGIWQFVVLDAGGSVPAADIVRYAAAQQRQILEHWSGYWRSWGTVRAGASSTDVRPTEVEVRLLDQPTLDGALGYHDCKPDGTPIIYVFVGLCRDLGEDWTSVASHEVLEVLGDPYLRLLVEAVDGSIWDREVCDRVEQDSYEIDGVKLSNFNTPACFEPPDNHPAGTKYDYLGLSTGPNEVRPGGYAQKLDPATGKWTQVGQMSAYRTALASCGLSRGARRAARRAA